jgi:hypothetical protein
MGHLAVARMPRPVAAATMGVPAWHASSLLWLLGSDWPSSWSSWAGRIGLGSRMWARPKRKGKGSYFPNLILNAKIILENLEIVLKA